MTTDDAKFDAVDLLAMAEDMGWSGERLLAAAKELVRIDSDIEKLFNLDIEEKTPDPRTTKQ